MSRQFQSEFLISPRGIAIPRGRKKMCFFSKGSAPGDRGFPLYEESEIPLKIFEILPPGVPREKRSHHKPRFLGKRIVTEKNHDRTSVPKAAVLGLP